MCRHTLVVRLNTGKTTNFRSSRMQSADRRLFRSGFFFFKYGRPEACHTLAAQRPQQDGSLIPHK